MPVEISNLTRKEKGTYVLVMTLKQKQRISIGKFLQAPFQPGLYLYVGKAKNGLKGRLRRHLSMEKRLFWHIDFFLQKARIEEIWIRPDSFEECQMARQIKIILEDSQWPMEGFGASDCLCPSHLLFVPSEKANLKALRDRLFFRRINFNGI